MHDSDDIGSCPSRLEFLARRGVVQVFVNATSETARTLAMLTPGPIGPARLREMATLLAAADPPDPAKVAET